MKKSSIEEIRQRFDADVERFANLDTGQVSTIDAQISLEIITEAAKRQVPHAQYLLDIGCGAGNYSLKMLSKLPGLHCTLVNLSQPMLDKAYERISQNYPVEVSVKQGDIRWVELEYEQYDIILAGAVLHHLRDDEDWEKTFARLYQMLRPGGCLMISDLVTQDSPALRAYFWEQYSNYLQEQGGPAYSKEVLAYIEQEDSPRSVTYQLELMKSVGFRQAEMLHKNLCFAAFGGMK